MVILIRRPPLVFILISPSLHFADNNIVVVEVMGDPAAAFDVAHREACKRCQEKLQVKRAVSVQDK